MAEKDSFEGSVSGDRSPAPAGTTRSQARPDGDIEDEGVDGGTGACAVCRGTPAPWAHVTETPASATFAMADSWHLCTACHGLLVAGDTQGVADRVNLPELDEAQRIDLARRLR